ncbi:MAG: glycosyl hydrolase, partial [bacterium]
FATPPDAARPWVWGHWLHGNVDRACITRELEAMKRVGLGGVTMFDVAQPGIPRGPHGYMTAEWQQLFAFEIAEAQRLGLEVMSHNGPGYCGNGGPWITPEFAAQKIVESATRIPGGRRFVGKLSQPAAAGGFYRDVALLAINETDDQRTFKLEGLDMKRLVWLNYIRWKGTRSAPQAATAPAKVCISPANIINLTDKMAADGSLSWDAPVGDWTLLRFGHTWTGQKTLPATPEGEGPECDKLDKRGIQTHFNHVMKRMVELAGPAAGKTFTSFFADSWEAGGQNWTARMPTEFRRRRGYDIIPFLPVMTGRVVGDLQTAERFLYDLRQTVSELVTENFWAEMQRLCHAQGMRVAVEPYITTGNDLDAANFTDEPMGEFWSHPFQPNDYRRTVKTAVSAANLNGRLIVGVEAFTASEQERWLSHPATMKAMGDQIFCLGANRFQFHRFAMQRFSQLKPGMTMGKWGQHYDSTQTWWEWTKPWHDYLARCQFMLRQGPVVADVLAVVPEEPLYRYEPLAIPGHDFDVCGPDAFRRIVVANGQPGIPGGQHYRLI